MTGAADTPEASRPVPAGAGQRFGPLLERRDGVDFPYYNGVPVGLTSMQWLLAWLSVVAGFAALVLLPQPNAVVALLPRVLFTAIPLIVLAILTGPHWRALFRRVSGRDVVTMIGFAGLNLVVSVALGLLVRSVFGVAENKVTDNIDGVVETIAFYAGTGIQLVGEELFTIMPLLALLFFLTAKAGLSRNAAALAAWLITAAWFAAAHLPTYDWNFAQAFIVIGGARLVLTLAYIRTKNLWVCAGAHIINDWVLFTPTVLAGAALAAI
ncbi:CPBP family intramembrane glutamic endopeptidase [Nocardia sp. NPDC019395]|uniref:CPBP family intramembrane glutamic endopeptidase n=1 Tax=Nocardia sp. NPDC019395 TaxID=3154686 RepID=UPI0033C9713F